MVDLEKKLRAPVKIGNQTFANPICLASGTAAFGEELSELISLDKLGAIILKGTTLHPKEGNPPPRLVETSAGLLNAIGLQNPGIDAVLAEKVPILKKINVPMILNVAGKSDDEFEQIAKKLAGNLDIKAIEVNMSCPNVEKLMDSGTDPKWVARIIGLVKKHVSVPVIAKITPNITDITKIAVAAEEAGADALSVINTLKGMAFDIRTQKPILANTFGGLSGPAIKPVAVRMVYEVRQKVKIPIVASGGILTKEDIFEFFCAGADMVQLGTLNFIDLNYINNLLNSL
jgi:dihydroorotate dehydrogenase (NAD+) catalytic subunit